MTPSLPSKELPPTSRSRSASDARPARTRPRRVRWSQVKAQWPLALVLFGVVAALTLVAADRWRRGAFAMGVVALGAAAMRAALPESAARLLAVRSRFFDTFLLVLAGIAILALSLSIDSLGTG